jgi:hypothetical protein
VSTVARRRGSLSWEYATDEPVDAYRLVAQVHRIEFATWSTQIVDVRRR